MRKDMIEITRERRERGQQSDQSERRREQTSSKSAVCITFFSSFVCKVLFSGVFVNPGRRRAAAQCLYQSLW